MNNKKTTGIVFLIALLSLALVGSVNAAYDTSGLKAYYNFDDSSLSGSYPYVKMNDSYLQYFNATFWNITGSQVTGKINNGTITNTSLTYSTTSPAINTTITTLTAGRNFTIIGWFKIATTYKMATNEQLFGTLDPSNGHGWAVMFGSNGSLSWTGSPEWPTLASSTTNTSLNDGAWHFICAVRNGTSGTIWLDNGSASGTAQGNSTALPASFTTTAVVPLNFGGSWTGGVPAVNATWDEFGVWENRSFTIDECRAAYNNSFGARPSTPAGTPTTYFSITASNAITSAAISTFNATINGTAYQTTNGTINTAINTSRGDVITITNIVWLYGFGTNATSVNVTYSQQYNLTPFANITGSDFYDNSSLTGLTVIFNGSSYYSSGASVLLPVGTYLYNATVNDSGYLSIANITNGNGTSFINVSLYQAQANFNAFEIGSGLSVSGFTVKVNTTNATSSATPPALYLKAGNYTFLFSKTGWYDLNASFEVLGLSNYTFNFSNVYAYVLNVSIYDSVRAAYPTNYTVNITSGLYPTYNASVTTTNGSALFNWPNDTNFFMSFYSNASLFGNSTFSTSNYTSTPILINISVRPIVVTFTVYDQATGALITIPITINMVGTTQQYNFTQTNGSPANYSIIQNAYNVVFAAAGYANRNYILSYLPTTSLTAYLFNTSYASAHNVTYTVTDLSNTPLQDVLVTSQVLISSNYTTVESVYTDFSGTATLLQDTSQFYVLTFSKSGYVTKITSAFKPVSSPYTVRLSSSTSVNFTSGLGGINYSFYPTNSSLVPAVYQFKFLTSSPSSAISSFGIYNATASNSSSSSPTGGVVYMQINYSGVNSTLPVVFNYYIINTSGYVFNFSNTYFITPYSENQTGSISNAINNANFSVGGAIIIGVIIIVCGILVLSTFVIGRLLGVAVGVLAVVVGALGLVSWTYSIMIAIIMFFAAWAAGR